MTSKRKKLSFILKRKSRLALITVFSIFVLLLVMNDDASVSKNMEYEKQISEMRAEIKINNDSAAYYKQHYEALLKQSEDIERTARERFHMHRPTEDLYLIVE